MATLQSDNQYQITPAAELGNLSAVADGKTLAAMQIADTLDLFTLPVGSKILSGHFVNAALGASTTMSVGWRYKDGTAGGSATALVAATATSSAGRVSFTAAPIVPTLQKEIVVYATLAGGAATGRFDAVALYEYRGSK